ncbi:MAG: phosphoglycolate phosphatase [Pseudomonadales bacterium]|nr:phosphoglycolate phosphatase [Pseudomonadales bacterium]MCP5185429.1 phosphoglycolate phosphatase [Pseudomonadales bacterium]
MAQPAWQRPYRAYLFDLDGTLVDTAPDLHQALNHTLTTFGYPPVPEHLTRDCIGHGARAMIQRALDASGIAEVEIDPLHKRFLEHYNAHIADFSQPYPDVLRTLDDLADRGAALGVVTNKTARLSRNLLDCLTMSRRFTCLVGGDSAVRPKPDAAPVLMALEQLGVPREEALFVGDSATDVGAARAAGLSIVCVDYGYSHGIPAHALGADGVISSFLDLIPTRR